MARGWGVGAGQGLPGLEALGRSRAEKGSVYKHPPPTSRAEADPDKQVAFKFQISTGGCGAGVFGCKNRNTRVCVGRPPPTVWGWVLVF